MKKQYLYFSPKTNFLIFTYEDDFLIQIQKGKNVDLTFLPQKISKQIDDFLNGKNNCILVKYRLIGTDFQRKVWLALSKIPFGKTTTYYELANLIGSPKSYRAVGNALNRNPLPLIIPCHRVIRRDGQIGGYSLGVDLKQYLLQLEKKLCF